MPHFVATMIYLSQIYSYYIRGDRSQDWTLDINRYTRTIDCGRDASTKTAKARIVKHVIQPESRFTEIYDPRISGG